MQNVLTDYERCYLRDDLWTEIGEALTIRQRFKAALAALNAGTPAIIPFGCPHCVLPRDGNCCNCRYTECAEGTGSYDCLRVSFGGVTAESVSRLIKLTPTSVEVYPGWRLGEKVDLTAPGMREQLELARTFCAGHIEWANVVLSDVSDTY